MSTPLSLIQGYRPDIDGLRAFAVLAVIGFHAFPTTVPGGFLGVDVFFVISGYLICGIILRDLEAGDFSFLHFYSRRIRRIFPALLLVLAVMLPLGWHMLLPDEYAALGKHILGGATFSSNFLLWTEAGYFDVAAKAKPLLHLWSLGIEEQFYIFFPFLLWCCARRHFRFVAVILFLALLSFLYNMHLHTIDRMADFYSPLSRIWELLAGAGLCAVLRQESTQRVLLWADNACAKLLPPPPPPTHTHTHTTSPDGRNLGLILAVVGVCLLGIGLLLARDSTPWPGTRALLPTAGALCLIAAGPNNPVSAILCCNRAAVFVGKISYPLYLWHWPLLSLASIHLDGLNENTRLLRVGLVLLAFLLAAAIYFFVESPIRFGQKACRAKIWCLVAGMVLMAVAGGTIYALGGLPEREKFLGIAPALQELKMVPVQDAAGLAYAGVKENQLWYCRYTDSGSRETVAVVGDSHAWRAYDGIARLGMKSGFNTVLLGWFVPGGFTWTPTEQHRNQIERVIKILMKDDIKKIFLITRGVLYIYNSDYPENKEFIRNHPDARPMGEDVFNKEMQYFIDRMNTLGKEVFIVAENPELPINIGRYFNRHTNIEDLKNKLLPLSKSDVISRQQPYLDILKNLQNATVIYTIDAFCPTGLCMGFSADGLPLYSDDDHLSVAGSIFQAEKILKPYLVRPRQP